MNSHTPIAPTVMPKPDLPRSVLAGWQAFLNLVFAKQQGQTRLIKKSHFGPLVIQKVLYPEGDISVQGVILHPPGGVAGGDQLQLTVTLEPHASVLLTTPGATKWYKSAGRPASQQVTLTVSEAAQLEWLPQENIVFNQANVSLNTQVTLAKNAKFATWEIVSLGRRASGEQWQQGQFKQKLSIYRQQRLIWSEVTLLTPDSPVMQSIVGLRGQRVFGSFIVAAGSVPTEVLEACRTIPLTQSASSGVTALPELLVARYMGNCPQQARQYFEQLWKCLRPWYAMSEAIRPRIWAT